MATAKERRAQKRAELQLAYTESSPAEPALRSEPQQAPASTPREVAGVAESLSKADTGDESSLTAKERRALKRKTLQSEYETASSPPAKVSRQSEPAATIQTAVATYTSPSGGAGRGGGRDAGRMVGGRTGGRGGGRTGPQFQGFDNRPPLPRPVPTGALSSSAITKTEAAEAPASEPENGPQRVSDGKGGNGGKGSASSPNHAGGKGAKGGKGSGKGDGQGGQGGKGDGKGGPGKGGKGAKGGQEGKGGQGGQGGKGGAGASRRPKNDKALRATLDGERCLAPLLAASAALLPRLGDDDACHALHLVARAAAGHPVS